MSEVDGRGLDIVNAISDGQAIRILWLAFYMLPLATEYQRWFIRALARNSGKDPAEWLRLAKEDGYRAPPSSHQSYLRKHCAVGYTSMTAPMAGRLIAWMRLRQMRPTYSPDDRRPSQTYARSRRV